MSVSYIGFAGVYDRFMDNVPYDDWTDYLAGLLKKYGVNDGLVCELGCGTGSVTERLAARGYDMIGIDNSEEMLNMAHEKQAENGSNALYLCQDMRSFELYGTVNAIVSVCDSMNYILTWDDLVKVFKLANNYLEAGGILIFDMNTPEKYEKIGDSVIAENRENMSFIWENFYDREKRINEYDLTIYASENVLDGEDGNIAPELVEEESGGHEAPFYRFDEVHYQRAYSIEEVKSAISAADMEFVDVFEAFTDHKPDAKSERLYFVAREKFQEGKKYI